MVIEVRGISIRENNLIRGIKIGAVEQKVSMLADDTTCFLNGDMQSFDQLFVTLQD
jgi:hypothetical protein